MGTTLRGGYPLAPFQIPIRPIAAVQPPPPRYAFLDQRHPIYDKWSARWELNERRLAGGDDVFPELRPFDWELDLTSETSSFQRRLREAVYANFPEMFSTGITGHLLRFAPEPDFGNLGEVRRNRDAAQPTRAEQVHYSVDSPSDTGTTWGEWWMGVTRRAMATGHRWLYCEGPEQDAPSLADELNGYRPYLVEFSPLDVNMWYYNRQGLLEFAIIRYLDYDPQFANGGIWVNSANTKHYLLLVRAGCNRLGPEFAGGGWFKFDPFKRPTDMGTWDDTGGEIPLWPHFYQRHLGTKDMPAISRPGTTELGNAAIAYMNLVSAANYNAWSSSQGIEWLAGIDEDGMGIADTMRKRGDRYIALVPNEDTGNTPVVHTSSVGAVPATVSNGREQAIWDLVSKLGVMEATTRVHSQKGSASGPGNTGAAQQAGFTAGQVPRIVHVAQNIGDSQNIAIYWLERRYGFQNPKGQVTWPKQFDLVELVERIEAFFNAEKAAGLHSPTIDAQAMTQYAVEKGIITSDDDRATALKEFKAAGIIAQIPPPPPPVPGTPPAKKIGKRSNPGGIPGNGKT